MSALGVNVTQNGADDPRAIVAAGASWVRFALKPSLPTRDIVAYYQSFGLKVLVCCDSDTSTGLGSESAAAAEYAIRIGKTVDAIQIGPNEFDQTGATSSTASEQRTFEIMRDWAAVWRHTNAMIVGPNLASGQPARWTQRLSDLVDVCALSRYPDEAEKMGDGIYGAQGYARFDKDIWITEFPWWSAAYGDLAVHHSDYPPLVYNWRSWKNAQASWLDGLLDINGQLTWRLSEFSALAKGTNMATTDEDIALLKKQQALTIEGMRRIVEGKWTGAEGAAGIIDTVDPANAGKWTPTAYPPGK